MLHSSNAALRFCSALLALSCTPALLAAPSGDGPKNAEDDLPAGRFVRVERNDWGRPVALQTAIARYVPASGEGELAVDLVACVHVGERSYYQALNKRLEEYDVVLYELVARRGTRVPKGGARDEGNPLVMLQEMTESALELESQVEHIDYTKANLVHADMSPDDMARAIRERGDDGVTLFLSITADLMRLENLRELERQKNGRPKRHSTPFDALVLLFDPDRAATLRQELAQQFEELGTGDLGGTLNTILIEDRNKAAMRVFQTELAKGRKRIAILYGAGHMPDFEKRLVADFGLKRDRVEWLSAWNLLPGKPKAR